MGPPYEEERLKDRLGPRDAISLHLGTGYTNEGLHPVPKARRGRFRNWFYCAIVDAKLMNISSITK